MEEQPLLGTFEQQVLAAILQIGSEAYPPSVLQWLEDTTGRRVNRGSLYVTLGRLEKKGLVRSSRREGGTRRGGRPLRYLVVTLEGRRSLRAVRASLLATWDGIEVLLGET